MWTDVVQGLLDLTCCPGKTPTDSVPISQLGPLMALHIVRRDRGRVEPVDALVEYCKALETSAPAASNHRQLQQLVKVLKPPLDRKRIRSEHWVAGEPFENLLAQSVPDGGSQAIERSLDQVAPLATIDLR